VLEALVSVIYYFLLTFISCAAIKHFIPDNESAVIIDTPHCSLVETHGAPGSIHMSEESTGSGNWCRVYLEDKNLVLWLFQNPKE
jgi:hypothetical protein